MYIRRMQVRVMEETGRGGAVTEHPNIELARRGYDAFARETWLRSLS